MDSANLIRNATPSDVAEITALYAHYVLHDIATFETVPPSAEDLSARMAKVQAAGHPWLVAEGQDGAILGYAYASSFRDRAAYRYTCENSIYLRHDCTGRGVGKALLSRLLDESERAGFRQMIAVIAGPGPGSTALHASAGFDRAGQMRSAGRKFGQWIDVVFMQRALGAGDTTPPPEEPK